MQQPLVSIIVPTRNSNQTLGQCLSSIKNQTYKNIELIVVDNNSTDNTKEIGKKFTDKVFNKGPERSAQRNFGAENATGNYFLFIDSDMELSENIVASCAGKMRENQNVKAIIIPEESFGKGFWATCKTLERSTYIGDDSIEAARFFDKETFLDLGGFDENLIACEDWDLSNKVRLKGLKIGRINSLIRHNEGRLSLVRTIRKKYYYGTKISKYLAKKPKGLTSQASFIRSSYLRYWRRLIKDPIHTIGFLFMKFCEFAAVGLGLLASKLKHE